MKINFVNQVLIGTHVHAEGDVVEFHDREAADLIRRGVAVEHIEPVREAVALQPTLARKAVRKGP